jgi:hypothetical protein
MDSILIKKLQKALQTKRSPKTAEGIDTNKGRTGQELADQEELDNHSLEYRFGNSFLCGCVPLSIYKWTLS